MKNDKQIIFPNPFRVKKKKANKQTKNNSVQLGLCAKY